MMWFEIKLVVFVGFTYLFKVAEHFYHSKINMLDTLQKNDHINYESFLAVCISTIFWRTKYVLTRLYWSRKTPEFACRITSLSHGLLVSFIGINQCFQIDSPFQHPEWRTSYMQTFLLVASLGYFIHDLVWCLEYQRDDRLIIAHHVYSIIALIRMLFKGYSGAQATCSLGCMEITNPFLQARWFIKHEGIYPSTLFFSVETTFVVVFVGIRIFLGSYILYVIFMQPKNDWDFLILSVAIYLMSWMFFLNIMKYLFIKYVSVKRQVNDLPNKQS